jgi:hypothetical protein
MDYEILPATDIWMPVTSEAGVTALLEGLAKAKVAKKPKGSRTVPKVAPPEKKSGAYGVADLARLFAIATEGEKISIICRSLGWPPNANKVLRLTSPIASSPPRNANSSSPIARGMNNIPVICSLEHRLLTLRSS